MARGQCLPEGIEGSGQALAWAWKLQACFQESACSRSLPWQPLPQQCRGHPQGLVAMLQEAAVLCCAGRGLEPQVALWSLFNWRKKSKPR